MASGAEAAASDEACCFNTLDALVVYVHNAFCSNFHSWPALAKADICCRPTQSGFSVVVCWF
jgi:hypothetical protein